MILKFQRLNREWKGNLAFNIYAPQLEFVTTAITCDQSTGHWMLTCWLNLNTKKNQRSGDEYMIQVQIIGAELMYHKGASNKMISKLDSFHIHRPKSIVRFLDEKGEEMGLEVDKDFCRKFLKNNNTTN